MARGRFLSTTVATDDRLNRLSIEAQLLYLLAIPHLDRDGLFDGRPEVVWAAFSPLRPQLRERVATILEEWVQSGLVIRYVADRTPVLFFPAFSRHQAGMRYERESASKFPPPPGFQRTSQGLTSVSDHSPSRLQRKESDAGPVPETIPTLNPASLRPTAGIRPDKVQDQHQGQHQDQVQPQDQAQAKRKVKSEDQHHHHYQQQYTQPRSRQADDDDGLSLPILEPVIERIAQLPVTTLRIAALEHLKAIPDWIGSRQYVVRSNPERLASLLTWLRLYTIFHEDNGWGTRSHFYAVDPFKDVTNPIGRIITQSRERTLAPLRRADLEDLLAELEDAASTDAPTQDPIP